MKTDETIKMLSDKDFLNKVYGYAYKRCNTSYDAEDLCQDIILAILRAVKETQSIENFYAFAWTVAHRVYADFCKKRKTESNHTISSDYSDDIINIQSNSIDAFLDNEEEIEKLVKIMREISYLSKIYCDVMVMYYLDEFKISVIAEKINISENAVKQRLFSARNTVQSRIINNGHL